MAAPRERPALIFARYPGEHFCQPVALCRAHAQIGFAARCQLVRFIEDHQIIRSHISLLEAREHALTCQGVYTHNEQIAPGSSERVAEPGITAGDNVKRQIEEAAQLVFPVAHQSCWRHDKEASDQPARQHLADDAGAGKTIMTGLYIREM